MIAKVELVNNRGAVIIDSGNLPKISGMRWYFNQGYATTVINGRTVSMHRYLLGLESAPKSTQVDHINGNKLDNRLKNLRVCTTQQNNKNTGPKRHNKTGFKGVSINKNGTIRARISGLNKKEIYLGSFRTLEEAARAFDEAAKELHGEFARLNFPDEAA